MNYRSNLTPKAISAGDWLTCRFAPNAPPLTDGKTYVVIHVAGRLGDHHRSVELAEVPDQLFGAWRFRAYDPTRDQEPGAAKRASPAQPASRPAGRRSHHSCREAELARPVAGTAR